MRQNVLGCEVDNLTMEESIDRIGAMVQSDRPHQHVVVNVDKIVKASRDPRLARIISQCDLISADGMPVVWASRLLGRPLKERVTGIDLFFALLSRAEAQGWRVYFLGARQTVLDRVLQRTRERHPQLQIAGFRHGYWTPSDEASVVEAIRVARPQLLFVAISSPFKEAFLAKHQALMKVPFAMGVGGTFDVMAGLVTRAPVWMQRSGLEWFYRFLQEPRRMFRRYFVDDIAFFRLLACGLAQRYMTRDGRQSAASNPTSGPPPSR